DYINRKVPGTDKYYKIILKINGKSIEFDSNRPETKLNKGEQMFNGVEVPFYAIEYAPTFPECDSELNEERKKCTSQTISRFVNRNFNTELAKDLNLKGRQRIHVIFKISKEGDIIDVKARAPHPELEKEAIRVINALPKMIPGEQKGKKVNVPYTLPIVF
ncbi:energy transducer TonB, partial [Aquimarina sp. U1-2]